MEKKHKLLALDSLVVGHASIVQMQQELSSNALPGSELEMLNPDLLYLVFFNHISHNSVSSFLAVATTL